jgi:hypothetical protein
MDKWAIPVKIRIAVTNKGKACTIYLIKGRGGPSFIHCIINFT